MNRDIEKIKKMPLRKGQAIIIQWLETGKLVSAKQAIQAFCYECMGYYQDAELVDADCGDPQCPLFRFNYYNKRHHPEFKKQLSEAEKQKVVEKFKKQGQEG